jgi:translation initiation factor IF-3
VFRGREIVHPETGQDMLKQVFEATQDIAMIEQAPLMEGRRMLRVIAPKGGVIKRAPTAAPEQPASAPQQAPAKPAAPAAPAAQPASK